MTFRRPTRTSSPLHPEGRALGDVAFERISIGQKVMAGVPGGGLTRADAMERVKGIEPS